MMMPPQSLTHRLAIALGCIAVASCSSHPAPPASSECVECGTDAAPPDAALPSPRGSASLHLVAVAGATCAPAPRWINVPIADIARPTVTGSMFGEYAVNGENGADVSCAIFLIGGGYAMSGELRVANGDRLGHVSANALIDPDRSSPQPISLDVEDEVVSPLHQGDCSLVPGLDGVGWDVALAPGRFWGKLVCSSLLDASDAGGASGCAIDEGYLELDTCR